MRILINAVNLKVGGGVNVVMNFLKSLIENEEFHKNEYLVLAPSGKGYENFNKKPLQIEIIPKSMYPPFKRLIMDFIWLKKRIEGYRPQAVFTMGNFAVPTNCKQAVLLMNPYTIYPNDRRVWGLLSPIRQVDYMFRNAVFKSRLKYADVIFTQTETAKIRLNDIYGHRVRNVKVIPTAFSRIGDTNHESPFFEKEASVKYLLSLTRYYPHKNLEILIPLARLMKERKSNFKIITTIDKNQGLGARSFLSAIKKFSLENLIINIGQVPMDKVPGLYSQVDALLLPTLMESFSATYIDSMTLGVPIFTSDRDFAKDVCGNAAFYFDPFDVNKIFETIKSAFESEIEIKNARIKGQERAKNMADWSDVTKMYIGALKDLVENE